MSEHSQLSGAHKDRQKNGKLHRVAWIIMTLAVVLLPVVFLPSPLFTFGVTKSLILTLGTILAFMFVLFGALQEGSISLPKHPIYLSALALPVIYVLSALLGGNFGHSFAGNGSEVDTVLGVLVLTLLLVAIPLVFNTKKKIVMLYSGLFVAFLIALLFQALKLILGGDALSFGVLFSNIGNLVGKWNDLGTLAGLFVLLSVITLELPLEKIQKIVLYITLIASLIFLALVNFTLVWAVVGIISLLFFIYTFSFGLLYSKATVESGERTAYVPIRPLVVFLISLVFVIAGGPIGDTISSTLNISQIEARPSWQATFELAGDALTKNPFLGVGPNNFDQAWLANKPEGINTTVFWNTDFTVGIGTIPSTLVTVGFVGLIAWLVLLGYFFWMGVRNIGKTDSSDPLYIFLEISSFLAALYGWIFLIAYVPNIVLTALTFVFMGVFIAVQYQKGTIARISISGRASPRQAFLVTFIVIGFLVAGVAWGYFVTSRYVASIFFNHALLLANEGGNIDQIEAGVVRATRLHSNDEYYRTLSEVYLLRLNQVLAQENVSEDVLRTQFQNVLAGAIGYAQNAIEANPKDYQNWLQLGRIYGAIVPLQIEGSYESAVSAYEEAQKLNPSNPAIDLLSARLALSANNTDLAKTEIQEALNKKGNYTEAVFLLSQIEASTGNMENAISAAQSAAVLSPNDPTVFFQLGILYYTQENYTNAILALERAVILLPTYSNAKYFLGLAYHQDGRTEDAIAQFEDVKTLNPENTEVAHILENLKAGREPLEGLTPPAPEDRDTLPLEEETQTE